MNIKRSHLAYALGTFAMGAALLLAAPASVLADDSDDSSRQPHLKSWSNKIPAAKRFVALADFNNEAVLDRETGLVWEQAPDTTLRDWETAITDCVSKNVGDTYGWRLPSVVELKSLQDPLLPAPYVPSSVFANIQSIQYPSFWSATTNAVPPNNAWVVQFWNHDVASGYKTGNRNAWCVRGGMNADAS